ncbi:hypothetical protein ACRPK2_05935 [Lactococcus garvieae]|uniref:hypothetical protein n=1 Tax=Lactococcus garvieae TaxID=1363 RepID=UPI003D786C6D
MKQFFLKKIKEDLKTIVFLAFAIAFFYFFFVGIFSISMFFLAFFSVVVLESLGFLYIFLSLAQMPKKSRKEVTRLYAGYTDFLLQVTLLFFILFLGRLLVLLQGA